MVIYLSLFDMHSVTTNWCSHTCNAPGQLNELLKTVPASLNVDVLTVDACQGSEFDFVVLSTVRCNTRGSLGFVADPQRLCVVRVKLDCFVPFNTFRFALCKRARAFFSTSNF